MSLKCAAEKLINNWKVDQGLLNMVEMAFRACAPCIACATHALMGAPLIVRFPVKEFFLVIPIMAKSWEYTAVSLIIFPHKPAYQAKLQQYLHNIATPKFVIFGLLFYAFRLFQRLLLFSLSCKLSSFSFSDIYSNNIFLDKSENPAYTFNQVKQSSI